MLHLQSEEPLFEQLILMSGTPLALPPLQPHTAETAYALHLKALDIQDLPAEERVQDIVHGPVARLWTNIAPGASLRPVIDNDVICRGPTHKDFATGSVQVEAVLPGVKWCRRVLLGDCQSDVSFKTFLCLDG